MSALKVLTLSQPWASLVAIGAKRTETRSWATPYRGPLAIHAAKGFPRWVQDLCHDEPFCTVLADANLISAQTAALLLPLGAIIATCRLTACLPTTEARTRLSRGYPPYEEDFGDFSPGRWAWLLEDVEALPTPIPAKGALGLWTFPDWRAP